MSEPELAQPYPPEYLQMTCTHCGHERREHKTTTPGDTTCLHGWNPPAKAWGITGCPCSIFRARNLW